ncbi:MAG: 50S ribosomal protein L18 [Elusimicrobia bacterium]|nr:50S ribosomal protein L18 [Elusimicrobiota bacterium]
MLSKKKQALIRRKIRTKEKIFGTTDRPRMLFQKSNKYIYVQFLDDTKGKTLLSISTKVLKLKNSANIKAAVLLGENAGKKAISMGIKQVVFDRSGYIYHGKVRSFADAVRASGVKF